jgi:predicted nucleic-acid-binding Zn-ribbon protein
MDFFQVGGIKCDNKTCDYHLDEVKFKNYDVWVNRPCPKCGSNLLTERDYVAITKLHKIMNSKPMQWLNWLFKKLGFRQGNATIEMNGTGKIGIVEIPEEPKDHDSENNQK